MKNHNVSRTPKTMVKNLLTTAILLTGIYGCTSTAPENTADTSESATVTTAPAPVEQAFVNYAENLQSAKLFAKLPSSCPTPDGLAIAPDGSLTLACTNWANKGKQPGVLLSVSQKGEVTTIGKTFKKKGRPMGIAYAPDGSLYVCGNGRITRFTFADGKIATSEVVAKGLSSPNGIRIHNGSVYATQLQMKKVKSDHMTSAVYRFSLDDRDVKVKSTLDDAEILFHVETKNPDRQYGLDGLVFDKAGHLYTGNFGDGEIYKLTLSDDGKKVNKQEIYVQLPKETGLDGIAIDDSDNLYVAGFLKNQVVKVDTNKKVTVLAEYPDNNGSKGELDQPSEVIVYGDKLIVSNFDLMGGKGIVNTKHSAPYTLSSLDLK